MKIKLIVENKVGNLIKVFHFPKSFAHYFNQRYGKFSSIVAKWLLQYFTGGREQTFPKKVQWFGTFKNFVNPILENELYYKLINFSDLEQRINFYNNSVEFKYYRDEMKDKYGEEDYPFGTYYGDDIENIKELIEENYKKIEHKLSLFESKKIIQDFLNGTLKDLNQYKNLDLNQANEKYIDSQMAGLETFLELENGFKWVKIKGKRCDIVRNKMKNCGSMGFHTFGSGEEAFMILLLDDENNPHIVATIEPDGYMFGGTQFDGKSRVSYIEGQASSEPKDKYLPYIKAMLDYVKPDTVYAPKLKPTSVERGRRYFHTYQINENKKMKKSNDLFESVKKAILKEISGRNENFKVGKGLEDADFWIYATGSEKNLGKPLKEYGKNRIGVKVLNTERILPAFMYGWFDNLYQQGFWSQYSKGSVIQFITVNDVRELLNVWLV